MSSNQQIIKINGSELYRETIQEMDFSAASAAQGLLSGAGANQSFNIPEVYLGIATAGSAGDVFRIQDEDGNAVFADIPVDGTGSAPIISVPIPAKPYIRGDSPQGAVAVANKKIEGRCFDSSGSATTGPVLTIRIVGVLGPKITKSTT